MGWLRGSMKYAVSGRRALIVALGGCVLTSCAAGSVSRDDGVIIFGASRNTGLEVARILATRGDKVTAFIRPSSDRSGLRPLAVDYAEGDALNAAEVRAAFAGKRFRAVISTMGGSRGETNPDVEGTRNIVDAAKAAGVKRMVMVTVLGGGDSIAVVPEQQRASLGRVIAGKIKAETYLIDSGMAYTILRPGQLTNQPANGKVRMTEQAVSARPITRADLAAKTVECLDDDRTIGKILYLSSTE